MVLRPNKSPSPVVGEEEGAAPTGQPGAFALEEAARARTVGGFGGGEERGTKGVAVLADGGGIAPAGHCRRTTGGALGLPTLGGRGSLLELFCITLAAEPVDG